MTMISRQAAEALFQEQVISTVLQDTPKSSVFMSLARRPIGSTATPDLSRFPGRDGTTSI